MRMQVRCSQISNAWTPCMTTYPKLGTLFRKLFRFTLDYIWSSLNCKLNMHRVGKFQSQKFQKWLCKMVLLTAKPINIPPDLLWNKGVRQRRIQDVSLMMRFNVPCLCVWGDRGRGAFTPPFSCLILRFTSGATPAECKGVSMAAKPFRSTYLQTCPQALVEVQASNPWLSVPYAASTAL